MKKKHFVLLVFGFILVACAFFFTENKKGSDLKESLSANHQKAFFISVPIKVSSKNIPYTDVKIEDRTFPLEIDLGFRGDLTLSSEEVKNIANKSFLQTKSMYGFRGKAYPTKLFMIPKLSIANMRFSKPVLQERNSEYASDSLVIESEPKSFSVDLGSVGWKLFYNVNFLLDAKRFTLAFCDSVETLKKQGYPVEKFTNTTLFLERGLIEFDVQIDGKVSRCSLDSGCTWNLVNIQSSDSTTVEEQAFNPSNQFKARSLKIHNKEFGPQPFRYLSVKTPVPVETILGMEFLQDHVVFIDFQNRQIYFAPSKDLEGVVPE